eukprot:scaffold37788_cov57-Cyclotella_meneghiniana.AAC.2
MTKKVKKKSIPVASIKGYLPIRVSLPPLPNTPPTLFTFIYVKEHRAKQKSNEASQSTLFVANAPANGPIRTDLFLNAVFRRYAEVERVTVARDPRKSHDDEQGFVASVEKTFAAAASFANNSLQQLERGDGKFAHVVFTSGKELKRGMKGIRDDMENNGHVQLNNDEIHALVEQTEILRRQSDNEDVTDKEAMSEIRAPRGIHAIVQKYKLSAYRHMPRQQLMELCNATMSSYEQSEAEAEARAKRLAEEPDEDGFITVTHGSSTPSFGAELETTQHQVGRGKGSKRNRKRKADNRHGGGEFSDFYKFQWKEKKKQEMSDLKTKFQDDLEKVKRMKEERAFRPF